MSLNSFLKKCLSCKYIFVLFFIFVFFQIGLLISNVINHIFEKEFKEDEDKYIFYEIILELLLAFSIRIIIEKYHTQLLDPLFSSLQIKLSQTIYNILFFAILMGLYQNLHNLNKRVSHLYEKYKNKLLNR